MKLKPLTEFVLLSEIVTQIKFAQCAANRLSISSDPTEVWESLQSLLVASANVSKILWPSYRKSRPRGKHLRELLSIKDDNILFDRSLRNHFEHYDERIEDWFHSVNTAVYVDLEINPFDEKYQYYPKSSHRSYNPIKNELTFRGDSINVNEILAELAKIKDKCQKLVLT